MTEEQVRENIGKALAEAGRRNPEAIILIFLKSGENFYACVCSDSAECVQCNRTIFSSIVTSGSERKTVPKEIENKKIMSISYVSPFDLVNTILYLKQTKENGDDEKVISSRGALNHIFARDMHRLSMGGKSLRAGDGE